jgi:hypothetical protein
MFTVPRITKPFDSYKWRWMEYTPVESFNRPDVLIGVTRAIAAHEGEKASSKAFIDELKILQEDLFPNGGPNLVPSDPTRNVIRRQGRYWRGLYLLSGGSTSEMRLTSFGRQVADGTYSTTEFATAIVRSHVLPNPSVDKPETVKMWRGAHLEIKPLEVILGTIAALMDKRDRDDAFLTADELRAVVVPLSIQSVDADFLSDAVLAYRKDPLAFNSLPNCAPAANDIRMLNEHLLFLYHNEILYRSLEGRRDEQRYSIDPSDKDSILRLLVAPIRMDNIADIARTLSEEDVVPSAIRERRLLEVNVRTGQSGFRSRVLGNFQYRCLLSGENTRDVLHACHIHGVADEGSNATSNGLCLRADLHILFDKNKLRFSPDGGVKLANTVSQSTTYSNLPNKVMFPANIDRELLRQRFVYGI